MPMTADELLRLPHDARYALVRGELRKQDLLGARDGSVTARIIGSLTPFVTRQHLGEVCAAAGFILGRDPDTVYGPPVAFVRDDRFVDTGDFLDAPPDVVFEIDSNVEDKTRAWLHAGVRAVVIVDPRTKSARIHRAGSVTSAADAIAIEDVIPGWRLSLAELFK